MRKDILECKPHLIHFLFDDISQFLNFDWFIIEECG